MNESAPLVHCAPYSTRPSGSAQRDGRPAIGKAVVSLGLILATGLASLALSTAPAGSQPPISDDAPIFGGDGNDAVAVEILEPLVVSR